MTTATATAPVAPSPFGELLKQRWAEIEMHQAEFCRLVGSPAGWVQQIREGHKTPPLDRMPKWADALRLTGARRALFLDLAAIAHLPPSARQRFTTFARRAHDGATT